MQALNLLMRFASRGWLAAGVWHNWHEDADCIRCRHDEARGDQEWVSATHFFLYSSSLLAAELVPFAGLADWHTWAALVKIEL